MATYVDLATLHSPVPRSKPPASWGAQIRENFEFLNTNRRFICTSSTRPTGFNGLEIYETDTNKVYIHDGSNWIEISRLGAWTTVTPTITQSGAVTKTTTYARWIRLAGRTIVFQWSLLCTGSGSAANIVTISLPVAGVTTALPIGNFYLNDASAGAAGNFLAPAVMVTTSTVGGLLSGNANYFGATGFTAALASGDFIGGAVVYEAASST